MNKSWLRDSCALSGASLGCEPESKAWLVSNIASVAPELEQVGMDGPTAEDSLLSASSGSCWGESSFKNNWEMKLLLLLFWLVIMWRFNLASWLHYTINSSCARYKLARAKL